MYSVIFRRIYKNNMASDKRFEAVPAEYAKERFIDDLERVLKSLKLIPCKTIMDIGSGILTNTKFMGLTLNFEEEDFIIAEKKEDKSESNNQEKKEDEEKFNDVSEFFLFQAKKDSRLAISFAKIYLNKIDASSQVTDNEAVHSIIKDLVKIVKFRDVSANISESSLESFSDLEISPQRKSSENSNGGSTSSPVSFPKSDIKPEVSTPSPPKLQVERKFKEESLHFSAYEKPDGAASCDVQLFLDEESEQKSITPEKNCNEREAKLRTPPTPPDGKCKKSKNQH